MEVIKPVTFVFVVVPRVQDVSCTTREKKNATAVFLVKGRERLHTHTGEIRESRELRRACESLSLTFTLRESQYSVYGLFQVVLYLGHFIWLTH